MESRPDLDDVQDCIYESTRFRYEWHALKAASNEAKHGITFQEAATVFEDLRVVQIDDPDHSEEEERWLLLGRSSRQRLLLVSYTERDDRFRIISAREATAQERKDYD